MGSLDADLESPWGDWSSSSELWRRLGTGLASFVSRERDGASPGVRVPSALAFVARAGGTAACPLPCTGPGTTGGVDAGLPALKAGTERTGLSFSPLRRLNPPRPVHHQSRQNAGVLGRNTGSLRR